jgi:hypothetical protein
VLRAATMMQPGEAGVGNADGHRGIAPQIELWWRPERLATPDKTR